MHRSTSKASRRGRQKRLVNTHPTRLSHIMFHLWYCAEDKRNHPGSFPLSVAGIISHSGCPSMLVPDQDEATQVPLSALQRLALQRRQAGTTSTVNGLEKPSGLASLAKGLSRKAQPSDSRAAANEPLATPSTTPALPNKLSKLSALAQKSAAQRAVPPSSAAQVRTTPSPVPNGSSLSKLALRIKAQKEAQEAASRPQLPADIPKSEPVETVLGPEFKLFHALRPAELADNVSLPETGPPRIKPLRAKPSPFGNVLITRRESIDANNSFARLYSGIISGPPLSAFQFNTPSPDDAVLAAREGTRLNTYKKASTVAGSRK
jgi:hypothetical protein